MIEYRQFIPADSEQCRNLVLSYVGDATGLDPARAAKVGGWTVSDPHDDLAAAADAIPPAVAVELNAGGDGRRQQIGPLGDGRLTIARLEGDSAVPHTLL